MIKTIRKSTLATTWRMDLREESGMGKTKEIIEKIQPQGLKDPDWGYGPGNNKEVVDLNLTYKHQ